MSSTATSNEAPPEHMVNFGCGHPDAKLLPMDAIADATQKALSGHSGHKWLQYGRENGNLQAREALARFLTDIYKPVNNQVVDPDTLCFTSGVSHGLQLACRALHRMHVESSQPLCFVEDPTYFLIPPIFQQSNYELDAVTTSQSSGLDLQDFETKARTAREKDPNRLILLYCIPVHHNPLGVSVSEENRKKLVQLCEDLGVYLLADEVYHGLGFPGAPKLTPMALYKSTRVISCSAFTKILCPGIRCGWIQTSNLELLKHLGRDGVLDSGGCSSQMATGIVAQMIQSGTMKSYMSSLQTEYARRCHHLCTELRESSTPNYQFEFEVPQGGYFLWVRVVGVGFVLDEAFRSFCKTEYNVDFKTGASCSAVTRLTSQQSFENCIRLCFAYYDSDALTEGVKRLCQAIENYTQAKPVSLL